MDYVIRVAAVFVVMLFIMLLKMKVDEKKGIDSAEKKEIARIIRELTKGDGQYTSLYAYWQVNMAHSRNYWYYAVGFSTEKIYIVPLSFAKGAIGYGKPFIMEKKDLGLINFMKKDGGMRWVSFYDENKTERFSMWVCESNTKLDKMHPVNIEQKEEAQAFMRIATQWAQEVNTAHGVTASGKI